MFTKIILLLLGSCLLLQNSSATVTTERTHHRGTPATTTTTQHADTTHAHGSASTHSHAHSSAPTHVSLTEVTHDKHEDAHTISSNFHEHDHSGHNKDHSHTTPGEDNFFTRFKTVLLALQDFHYLIFSTLENAQFFFTNVIADVSATHDKTDQLKMKITELTKYVTKVDRFRHSVKLLDDFTHMLDSLNATAKEKPSAEDLIIDGSMRKLKLDLMEQRFSNAFNTYGKRLGKEIESFEKSLTDKEQAKDSDIKAWIVEIKDLTKKLESYGDYFDKRSSEAHVEEKKKA